MIELETASVAFNDNRDALLVTGSLSFKNVVRLRNQGKHCLAQQTPAVITVDLQGIEQSDNSGLVLLVAWMRDARLLQKKLVFRHVPAFFDRMSQVFGLHSILFTRERDNG